MTETRALLRLMAGAALISFSAVFVKLVSVPPTAVGFYRTAIGGAVLVVLVALRRMPVWLGGRGLSALVLAALFFAADLAAWHRSIVYVGPGLATLLANFQVFILALAGFVLFGERPRWYVTISIPLAFVGLGMIVGFDWDALARQDRLGVAFGLTTAVVYAGYILSLRRARVAAPGRAPEVDLALVSIMTALVLGAGSLAGGESLAVGRPVDALVLLAYGVVGQVLGWVLISGALPHVPAARVGLVLLLQPTLSFVWDVWFFGRPIEFVQAAGALLALSAIYLGSRR